MSTTITELDIDLELKDMYEKDLESGTESEALEYALDDCANDLLKLLRAGCMYDSVADKVKLEIANSIISTARSTFFEQNREEAVENLAS